MQIICSLPFDLSLVSSLVLDSFIADLEAEKSDSVGKVALLVADGQREMEELLKIRRSVAEMEWIVVLPDRQAATVSLGLRLLPSFLTYTDANLADIGAVLQRIKDKYGGALNKAEGIKLNSRALSQKV